MRNAGLAKDYVGSERRSGWTRLTFCSKPSWPDVVRESQEVVGLALKGLLRSCGIDPPRIHGGIHNVSEILLAEKSRLPAELVCEAGWLAEASRRLRRDRELLLRCRGPYAFRILLEKGRRKGSRLRPPNRRARVSACGGGGFHLVRGAAV